jgi:hypothetical protein
MMRDKEKREEPKAKPKAKKKKDEDDDDAFLNEAFEANKKLAEDSKKAERDKEDAFQAVLQPLRARMNANAVRREAVNRVIQQHDEENVALKSLMTRMEASQMLRNAEVERLKAKQDKTPEDVARLEHLDKEADVSYEIYTNQFVPRQTANQQLKQRVMAEKAEYEKELAQLNLDIKAFRAKYGKYPQDFKIVLKGGAVPPRSDLQQMARQAYKEKPELQNAIGNNRLFYHTPTLKFYMNGNTIIVAIRGSKDSNDWVDNNSRIPFNGLRSGSRYITDANTIRMIKQAYPNYEYYGVAHSLGGALLDLFLDDGLISRGLSYNPAVQTKDFNNTSSRNERIYHEGDPLYNTMGRMLNNKPEVRPDTRPKDNSWTSWLVKKIPYVGNILDYGKKAQDALDAHNLKQFEGGSNHFAVSTTRGNPSSKFQKQLESAGIEPSSYLDEARRRAKENHYPYKLLGFASDGVHKLTIPDRNGKLVSFGAVGYGDFLIYSHQEEYEKVPKGTADAKKRAFQRSHQRIKGDWRSNPFSPNNLALKILW